MITKEEKEKIKSDVERFLKYLLIHPILIENNSVKEFFSEDNREINPNQTLNTNKMSTFIENNEEEGNKEDLQNEEMNKSDNIIIENNSKKEKEIKWFEIIEKED